MKKWIYKTMPALLFFCLETAAQKNENAVTIGERTTLVSSILGETRNLLLYAPDNKMQRLPLIIVFDGESLFTPVVSAVRFMNYSSEIPQMPEAVVVGITNTDRTRDMPIPQQFGEKGEDNFRKFLVEELVPFIKNKYPLNGHIIVVGHSQGGLFVSYLLSKSPEYFPWAIALDAPMNVDVKTKPITDNLVKVLHAPGNKIRYTSAEAIYGWDDKWTGLAATTEQALQIKFPDESHESMPFKSIYDGLKFLYHDFSPARKDFALPDLRSFYQSVSQKYGYTYEVPLRVLLASVGRKLMENRKAQVTALLDYAEEKYGGSTRITALKTDAAKLKDAPDTLIDHYLNLPRPTPAQVKNYIGRWVGTLKVTDGQDMPVDMEILVENGKTKLQEVQPWPPYKKEEPEIFSISDDGKLIFGRRNRGAGVVISVAQIDKSGKLTGDESLLGFVIKDDFPEDVKKQMQRFIDIPNTFILTKK